MISISLRIEFCLFFIQFLPLVSTQGKIKLFFYNAKNFIRCSADEVQVLDDSFEAMQLLENVIGCNNTQDIYDDDYVNFYWDYLDVICDDQNLVIEEIILGRIDRKQFLGRFTQLPKVQLLTKPLVPQSAAKTELVILEQPVIKIYSLLSSPNFYLPVNNLYERRFYLAFDGHNVLCRVRYYDDDQNSCSSFNNVELSGVEYTCYYNPLGNHVPTIEEFEAEMIADEKQPAPADPVQPKPQTVGEFSCRKSFVNKIIDL